MELKIDPEFKSLIPPQSKDEHDGLENSILVNLFDPAYPIITWDGFIVDGHNRYDICKKLRIDYSVFEKDFNSRSDVRKWILDNQLNRRNLMPDQYSYLIGKRYEEEKRGIGRPEPNVKNQTAETDGPKTGKNCLFNSNPPDNTDDISPTASATNKTAADIATQIGVSERQVRYDAEFGRDKHDIKARVGKQNGTPSHQSDAFNSHPGSETDDTSTPPKTTHRTAADIAKQTNKSEATVQRDGEFAKAVDIVAKNVGINPQRILSTYYQNLHQGFLASGASICLTSTFLK